MLSNKLYTDKHLTILNFIDKITLNQVSQDSQHKRNSKERETMKRFTRLPKCRAKPITLHLKDFDFFYVFD